MKKRKVEPKSSPARGRRPATSPKIDRETILNRGLELAKTIPLQELSVVRIASDLGVTAASIRYHLQGRDALTAGVINMFYRDLLKRWPPATGDWRDDLSEVANTIYRAYLRYPGVAAYFAAENRFRIVASALQASDGNIPPIFFERYFGVMREVGLDVERTTSYAVILLQLLHMAAHNTNRHQWPGEHKALKAHMRTLDAEKFPHTASVRESYLAMAGDTAFKAALNIVLSGLEMESNKLNT